MPKNALNFSDRVKLATWLQANKDSHFNGADDLVKAAIADTGLQISRVHVRNAAKALGLKLNVSRPAEYVKGRPDHTGSLAVLARLVRRVFDEAGITMSEDERNYLGKIIARKTVNEEVPNA